MAPLKTVKTIIVDLAMLDRSDSQAGARDLAYWTARDAGSDCPSLVSPGGAVSPS
jgi:hypothetical protein